MEIKTIDQYMLSNFGRPLSRDKDDETDFKKILDDCETCEEYVVKKLMYLEDLVEEAREARDEALEKLAQIIHKSLVGKRIETGNPIDDLLEEADEFLNQLEENK